MLLCRKIDALAASFDPHDITVHDREDERVTVLAAKVINRRLDAKCLIERLRESQQRHRTDVVPA